MGNYIGMQGFHLYSKSWIVSHTKFRPLLASKSSCTFHHMLRWFVDAIVHFISISDAFEARSLIIVCSWSKKVKDVLSVSTRLWNERFDVHAYWHLSLFTAIYSSVKYPDNDQNINQVLHTDNVFKRFVDLFLQRSDNILWNRRREKRKQTSLQNKNTCVKGYWLSRSRGNTRKQEHCGCNDHFHLFIHISSETRTYFERNSSTETDYLLFFVSHIFPRSYDAKSRIHDAKPSHSENDWSARPNKKCALVSPGIKMIIMHCRLLLACII